MAKCLSNLFSKRQIPYPASPQSSDEDKLKDSHQNMLQLNCQKLKGLRVEKQLVTYKVTPMRLKEFSADTSQAKRAFYIQSVERKKNLLMKNTLPGKLFLQN